MITPASPPPFHICAVEMLIGAVLSPTPLKLLIDLAYRQSTTSDLDLPISNLDRIGDTSPLPLSIPALLALGILDVSEPSSELKIAIERVRTSGAVELLSTDHERAGKSTPTTETTLVILEEKEYTELVNGSIDACGLLLEECHRGREGEGEGWKRGIGPWDLVRILEVFEENMRRGGRGLMIAVRR